MSYKPFIFKLNNIDVSKIFDNNDVIKSSNINQPLFSLGFHSFIHRTKSAMSITEKIETKNKNFHAKSSRRFIVFFLHQMTLEFLEVYLAHQKICSCAQQNNSTAAKLNHPKFFQQNPLL